MLLHAKQAERGAEVGYSPPHTLPWRWKRVADKPHATATLPPGNRTGIHYSAAWVEIGEGVDGSRKPRPPPPGFITTTVQPVVSRCTDYVTKSLR